jgi:hypothetical protein
MADSTDNASPFCCIALDFTDRKDSRDWELFLTAVEQGTMRAAHIHGVNPSTVTRAKKRILFTLKRVKKPVVAAVLPP